jgi:hypothetical protein
VSTIDEQRDPVVDRVRRACETNVDDDDMETVVRYQQILRRLNEENAQLKSALAECEQVAVASAHARSVSDVSSFDR